MFTLKLTEQEVNTILAGLGELKAKYSIDLIDKIKNYCDNEIKITHSELNTNEHR